MLISVVIPTRFRPTLLQRAIDSALGQTHSESEILVVVDGPDPETVAALAPRGDARLRLIALEANVGLAEARNVGARAAKGTYVAFLDDDDEWFPEKLEKQLALANHLGGTHVFVSCYFLEKTRTLERVMPLSVPEARQHFSEYIYCQGGYLQPSTFFASHALLIDVPFTSGLRYIEDTDWLLRAMSHRKVQLGIVPQILSIYYNFKEGNRESELTPWRVPFEWAKAHHNLFTRKAFPFYIARLCVNARRAKAPISTFFLLMWTAFRLGRLTPKALAYFVAYWMVSDGALKKLKALHPASSRSKAVTNTPWPSTSLQRKKIDDTQDAAKPAGLQPDHLHQGPYPGIGDPLTVHRRAGV